MIPNHIIATGSPEHLKSEAIQTSVKELQSRNRSWKIHIFSDAEQLHFINKHCTPEIRKSYSSINPRHGAALADFFRYLATYILGGVYLDIKSTCLIPFDALLRSDDSLVVSQWDNHIGRPYEGWGLSPETWDTPGGEYINWFFAANTKNLVLLEVIKLVMQRINSYKPSENNLGRNGILRTTGPIAWTRAITSTHRRHRGSHKYRFRVINPRDSGLIYSIFDSPNKQKDLARHRMIFKNHYSLISEPVIIDNPCRGE